MNSISYKSRIMGDATGEMGPFYYYADEDESKRYHNNWGNDFSNYFGYTYNWLYRGGHYKDGILSGLLFFDSCLGSNNKDVSFRIVLAN